MCKITVNTTQSSSLFFSSFKWENFGVLWFTGGILFQNNGRLNHFTSVSQGFGCVISAALTDYNRYRLLFLPILTVLVRKKSPTFSQVHYLFANQSILYSLQTKIVFLFSRKHAATLEQATGGLISSITSFVCGVLVSLVLLWIIIASLMSMKQPNLYFHVLFLCCRLGVCL